MKPNFALSLSFDGLHLMHRVTGGWHLVGQVALDDANLTGALERLREAAETLEPNGITTKLLIPNDQIKYLALDTTRAQVDDVREALHGATPYAVDDLVYDYAKGGGRTYVAAVAKETLNEAQQFAHEHGFNPVSFAAVPEPFTYVGEAFFGSVDGKDAERDTDPVVVIGDAGVVIQAPAPVAAPVVEPIVETTPVVEAVVEPTPDPIVEPAAIVETVVEDVSETPADTPDPADDFAPDVPDAGIAGEAPESDVLNDADETSPVVEIEVEAEVEVVVEPTPEPPTPPIVEDIPAPLIVDTPDIDTAPDLETTDTEAPAPMFASRLRADRNEGRPAPTPDATPTRSEPTFSRQTPPSLAVPTGKGTDPMPPLSAPSRDGVAAPVAVPVTTKTPDADVAPAITGDAPTALSPDAAIAAAALTIAPDDSANEPELAVDIVEEDSDAAPSDDKSVAASAKGAAAGVGGAVSGMFASRRMARAEAKTAAKSTADAESADTPDEKSRLTVFGARKQPTKKPKIAVGGKPRFLGLILTAVLLLFLLAMAAFAALSEEGFAGWFGFGQSQTQIAATPDPAPSASEVAAPQAPDATQLAALDEPDALASPTAPAGGTVLTPEEATRIYAATGVWQRAPRIPQIPRTTTLDTLALAVSPRPVVRVPSSPLASASSVAGDALIATPIDPPPPSQTFDFNDEGQVVATTEGAVTPDGILVIVGRPPLNPPTRPGTVAPEITPQDQLAAVIPEAAIELPDAPEGVIVIAGRPSIEPPVRTGTAAPAPAPEAIALATGDAPLVATDGLLVLAGSPPVLPPARPGTVATPVAVTPEIAPEAAPEIVTVDPATPDIATPDIATPDAPLPEGLNVIAGSPSILPPVRPGTVAPQAAVDALTTDIAVALTTSTAQAPTADTRRPTTRPAALVAATVAAAEATAAAANTPVLGALTIAQANAFRPRTRPSGLAPERSVAPEDAVIEPAAVTPTAPTGLQISPAIAAAVEAAANRPNPIVNPTALAVPVSSRPDLRPNNMARIVARATAAQERAATQVAAVAPRTVAPSGPTAGSVATAATLDNAINLRDLNLIGIYGGSGDRRALIRMGNGSYVRVTVGDRLDGGQVTAISAEVLNYTKRGRAITLRVAG